MVKERIKRVLDFDDQFKKWYDVKKHRYNVIKMKFYFSIYDSLKFAPVNGEDGDLYIFEMEEEARAKKNELNEEWSKKLVIAYEARKQTKEIWDPMFLLSEEL